MEPTPIISNPETSDISVPPYDPAQLHQRLTEHQNQCSDCGACRRHCEFLQKHGTPGEIARNFAQQDESLPFECSLCGLCNSQCPEKLDIKDLFLQMRRNVISTNPNYLKNFRGLRVYETIGVSDIFSCYALPEHCEIIFFPGCALTGNNPQQTWNLYRHLQQQIPNLGLVLDCCTKPSHDLGDQQRFANKFNQLCSTLYTGGVRQILTACPNCYTVFKTYAPQFKLLSVFQQLDQSGAPQSGSIQGAVTVHDPCVHRFEPEIHQAVRSLINKSGLTVTEMTNKGRNTFCCGEGGCVMATKPKLAHNWRQKRALQSKQHIIVTYCAGCVEFLAPVAPTVHLLDLLFDPTTALNRKEKHPSTLTRYRNRLKIKKRLKKEPNIHQSGVRSMITTPQQKKTSTSKLWLKLAILSLIIATIVTLKLSGITASLDPQHLQNWISSYGLWAPLIFILLYSVAPALFLPGLPLTILGGVLFGPIWGVVYTITGATIGASIAFLIARYIGRDWISTKLSDSRWQKLDADVAHQGWKVVAFTRLIPLFPFNLLNYAFGLTSIRFSHYCLTSFICMLPATIAFISLSSSLGELIKGNISKEFIIGVILIIGLSLLPIIWKKRAGKSDPGK
jgi:uncharacterized membrane protein YdjX (TVP38/TMEM64 family)/Fe-S oxidoreductase